MFTPIDVHKIKMNAEVVYCPSCILMFPAKIVQIPRDVTGSWAVKRLEPVESFMMLYLVDAKDLFTCSEEEFEKVMDIEFAVANAEAAESVAANDMEIAHREKRLALEQRIELAKSLKPSHAI